jgi:hypothetical protein
MWTNEQATVDLCVSSLMDLAIGLGMGLWLVGGRRWRGVTAAVKESRIGSVACLPLALHVEQPSAGNFLLF